MPSWEALVSTARRYTSADLEALPEIEGVRYEILDGQLHVSKQPHWEHQFTTNRVAGALDAWSEATGRGVTIPAPGVLFPSNDDAAPDVVWISRKRLITLQDEAGHLRGAPELMVEVLSPGAANERRDRDVKLRLYSRQGVEEYWLVDWRMRTVEVFRRADNVLLSVASLKDGHTLTSPLLPGFACPVARLWPPSLA